MILAAPVHRPGSLRSCVSALPRGPSPACGVLRLLGRSLSVVVRSAPQEQPAASSKAPATAPVAQKEEDLPPWVRREKERQLQLQEGNKDLPWPLYLLFSCFVAIAAVGSIFEYVDKNPIFGVVPPDSPLWAPILLGMAITGWPTAGFLFIKGVNGFNAEAEKQDKLDGYL